MTRTKAAQAGWHRSQPYCLPSRTSALPPLPTRGQADPSSLRRPAPQLAPHWWKRLTSDHLPVPLTARGETCRVAPTCPTSKLTGGRDSPVTTYPISPYPRGGATSCTNLPYSSRDYEKWSESREYNSPSGKLPANPKTEQVGGCFYLNILLKYIVVNNIYRVVTKTYQTCHNTT